MVLAPQVLVQVLQRIHPCGDDVTELALREEIEAGPAVLAGPVAHEGKAGGGNIRHADLLVQLQDKLIDGCGGGEFYFLRR